MGSIFHRFREQFGLIISTFWYHFSILFRHWFLHVFFDAFLATFGRKWSPTGSFKDVGDPPFGAQGPLQKRIRDATSIFHWSRLPAAIVPPPGLGKIICMRKICKKFDARSMQVYFFATYCLKGLISPTTNQNETPRVQNNQNLALQGTKRDPICAKRTPKWGQRVPKGRQKWARNQQKYHKKFRPRKMSILGGRQY